VFPEPRVARGSQLKRNSLGIARAALP